MRGITRRAALAALAAAPAPAMASAIPAAGHLSFLALRNGSPLGTHRLDFRRDGAALTVAIAVDYVVRLGPIPVFRYALRATETWRGDALLAIQAETSDNGDKAYMKATLEAGRLTVDGSKSGRYVAPPGAIAATHWNRREVEAPMINPQDGELLSFALARGGMEAVPLASGGTVQAVRHALTGPSTLDLWYEPDGTWAGLRAVARDGSTISYRRE